MASHNGSNIYVMLFGYFILNHNCSPKVEHQQMCPFQLPLTVLDNILSILTLVNRCLDIQQAQTFDTGHI